MFTRLEVKNFTVFNELALDLSPGINALIGVNGTGKTHLMKLLYCLMASGHKGTPIERKLNSVFRPSERQVSRLVRRIQGSSECSVKASWDGTEFEIKFSNKRNWKVEGQPPQFKGMPVYIPVKESLSFAPGFRSLYNKYDLEFEEIYYDILELAYLPPTRGIKPQKLQSILESISAAVRGTVELKGEQFFLKQRNSRLEIPLVAEGMRKLALVWQLIQNGALYNKSVLFWDEPEANLNPSMMPHLARILVDLQALGTQIFVATHNYAFLKELELARKKTTKINYYALYFTGKQTSQEVSINTFNQYIQIQPNAIADEYLRIYDEELKRALGGKA
ncbi:ATP/GTP-binding protein [Geothrix sp. 21YS21S-4]|uniref:AAA family ATPase n=1 Tax=Geothrix sp. 21YS21S-4 TaxID=3068889 RepID=UPI0027B8EFB7|nr:AAA family ATPase [Geothrix sp. 21YS21S-4]